MLARIGLRKPAFKGFNPENPRDIRATQNPDRPVSDAPCASAPLTASQRLRRTPVLACPATNQWEGRHDGYLGLARRLCRPAG